MNCPIILTFAVAIYFVRSSQANNSSTNPMKYDIIFNETEANRSVTIVAESTESQETADSGTDSATTSPLESSTRGDNSIITSQVESSTRGDNSMTTSQVESSTRCNNSMKTSQVESSTRSDNSMKTSQVESSTSSKTTEAIPEHKQTTTTPFRKQSLHGAPRGPSTGAMLTSTTTEVQKSTNSCRNVQGSLLYIYSVLYVYFRIIRNI